MFDAILAEMEPPRDSAAGKDGATAIFGDGPAPASFLTRIARTRAATRLALTFERAWPLILPLLIVVALYLSAAWLGWFRLVPDWLRIASGAVFALAALGALYPLRRFRLPGEREIDDRIERTNALQHRPITTQTDRLAGAEDPFSTALWREHQKRIADGIGRLGAAKPHTGIPRRDPWALRAVAGLLLVVAFAYSYGSGGGRIADVLTRHDASTAIPPRIDAWVTPPAYTGRAPVFMTADANRDTSSFNVPWGSAVAVRVTGGSGAETLDFAGGNDEAPKAIEPKQQDSGGGSARQFAFKLEHDGTLSLGQDGKVLRDWSFTVIPDKAPAIRFTDEPKRAANGALELSYAIDDDYGAKSAEALISLAGEQNGDARPLYDAPKVPLALPRRNDKDGAAKTSRNLTEHPWAGAPVRVRLKAVDAAGQEAFSEIRDMTMPGRTFTNPLARAIIEQRRILALDANRVARVLLLLESLMIRPEVTLANPAHFLGVSTIRSRLRHAGSDDDLRGVVDYMWEVALQIEDGDLSIAERRLRDAQQALRDALEKGASDQEIEKLMNELRQAMNEFLREFAERSLQNPNMPQMPQQGQELRRSDLDRMLDQIENLARSGARDKAKELLSQLENMMNNLQAGNHQQGRRQENAMRQQLNELGEIMRRQQELMNETFRLDRMQRGQQGDQGQQRQGQRQQQGQNGQQGQRQPGQQGQQGENQPGQGQNGMSADELAEALRQLREGQGQLQGQLGEMMDRLRGLGLEPGEGFGEAGDAMGRAGEALGRADGEAAVGNQGQALEALRRGAQDMMNQMMQARQGDQGGSEQGGMRQGAADRDPLGRPRASSGPDFGESVDVPDEIDTQRAREILEAIRRRLGNALSPEVEKRYLERLLELQ